MVKITFCMHIRIVFYYIKLFTKQYILPPDSAAQILNSL